MGFFVYISLALLIAGSFLTGSEAVSCPGGWMRYQSNCYGFFTDGLAWPEAEIDCQSYSSNGHLASILNRAEGAVVAKFVLATYIEDAANVWIGLYDPQRNRRWKWTDESMTNYKPWGTGEPNNVLNNEYCVQLLYNSGYVKWNDKTCKKPLPYLCKYKL